MIYLSPSTQEYNDYVNGSGTEEEWMNRLADAMEPMLFASGIAYSRNTPDMTAGSSIRASNAGEYDLHLALHSNAAGEGNSGKYRGILVFYFPGSGEGLRAANTLVDNLRSVYPIPELVRTEPTTTLGEIRRVRAPAVLLELGFHDNEEDAQWIVTHIPEMADAIVLGLTEYFGIPFFFSSEPTPGEVRLEMGYLNVYSRPDKTSPVVARLFDETQVEILNEYNGWYLIRVDGSFGYADADFIAMI